MHLWSACFGICRASSGMLQFTESYTYIHGRYTSMFTWIWLVLDLLQDTRLPHVSISINVLCAHCCFISLWDHRKSHVWRLTPLQLHSALTCNDTVYNPNPMFALLIPLVLPQGTYSEVFLSCLYVYPMESWLFLVQEYSLLSIWCIVIKLFINCNAFPFDTWSKMIRESV